MPRAPRADPEPMGLPHLADRLIDAVMRRGSLGALLAVSVLVAVALTEVVCVAMSLWLRGEVASDYLLTGAVAPIAVATPMLALFVVMVGRLRRVTAELERLSRHDPLTLALNRRAFDEAIARQAAYAGRHGTTWSLMLFDLDGLKQINDRWGHGRGDTALRATVAAVEPALRGTDQLFRLGGDEFAIVLPEAGLEGALILAERLLALDVRATHDVPVGFSLGVATYEPDRSLDGLMARADAAVYAAKRAGGRRVVAAAASPLVPAN